MDQNPFASLAGQGTQQNTPGVPLNSTASTPSPSAPGDGNPFAVLAAQPSPGGPREPSAGFTNPHGDGNLDTDNPNDSTLTHIGKGVAAVGAGVGKGLLDTMSGAADLVGLPHQALDEGRAELDKDNAANPTLNSVGYGGETLAEFMLGDEALKGLSFGEKLDAVAKAAKVLQKSPRLMGALKAGAAAAAVQGAQTTLRAPGTLVDRLKEGVESAGLAGAGGTVLGYTGELLGDVLQKSAKAGKDVPNLANIAATSKSSPEVVQALSQRIGETEKELHQGYENGINDLKDRLGGADVAADKNPMQAKAKELLAEPIPGDHPAVAQGVSSAGEGMDASTRKFLESIANGNDPAAEAVRDEELAEKAKQAAKTKPSGLFDASGKPVSSSAGKPLVEPEPIPARPYTIDDLVKMRQVIRQNIEKYEPGDTNARSLRSLLWDKAANNGAGGSAVDDTIENLAKQSGDPDAVKDYQALRANYRAHINDYDDPLIQKIREGKLDDAASQYVGLKKTGASLPSAGKVVYNTNVLRNILGDDGLHQFGREVFDTMVQGATADGKFDPAKFTSLWNRVNDYSKGDQGVFNLNDAANGMKKLATDAKSAATIQHLTRLGLFSAAAGAGFHFGGLGTLLGLTVAEGGGIATGRDMLNWVANHPNTWHMWTKAAPVAAAVKAPGLVNRLARGAVGQGANAITRPDPSMQRVYQDGASGLQ